MGDIPVVTVEQQKQHFFELMQLHRKCQHIVSELTQGNEDDIIHILKQTEQMRMKWLASYNENQGMKTIIENMNTESVQLRSENKKLQALVTESRAQISALMTRQETVDMQRQQFEEAFELLRQILNDDNEGASTLLNAETKEKMLKLQAKHDRNRDAAHHASIASEDNISYDQTNDELDVDDINVSHLRSGTVFRRDEIPVAAKKRSRSRSANTRGLMSLSVAPPTIDDELDMTTPKKKRSRGENITEIEATPKVSTFQQDEIMQPGGEKSYLRPAVTPRQHRMAPPADGRVSPLNRSFSVPDLTTGIKEQPPTPNAGSITPSVFHALRPFASVTSLTPRLHCWTSKNIYTSEHCDECLRAGKSKSQSRIAFARKAFTCVNCKVTVCEACRDRSQVPCIPKSSTPRKNQWGFLAEFCSAAADLKVPHILIHLCTTIEARGLNEEGLYRVPGSDAAVRKLVEEFLWGRGVPNLNEVDVPTMTGAMKRFIMNLKEPIVSRSLWHDFYRAATMTDKMDREVHLYHAINKLPFANRDTLAYLCLHLQRVAENSHKNKMTLDNLSLVLAPTIVGLSVDEPTQQRIHEETPKQKQIMDALLEISGDYWAGFVKNTDVQMLMMGASPGMPPKQVHFARSVGKLYPTIERNPFYGSPNAPSSSMLGSWNPAKGDQQKDSTFTTPTPRYRTRQQQNKGFFQKPWR